MKKVTCCYCEFFECLYTLKYPNYNLSTYGECRKLNKCVEQNSAICEEFRLRQGLHTKRWYPNKLQNI